MSPDAAMPDEALAQFNPVVQYAELGWVPDGSVGSSVSIRHDLLDISAQYAGLPTNGDEPAPASVQVWLPSAGQGVDPFNPYQTIDSAQMTPGTPAEPVNGRSAQWVELGIPATFLRWEYAPRTWAMVMVSINMPDVDTREVARTVAENVRYAVDAPVALPFSTTGVPAELPLAMVYVTRHEHGWSAQADFGTDRTSYGDWPLTILAVRSDAETGDGNVIGDPDTTLDGHPARIREGLDGGSTLQVFNVDGVYVEMLTHSPSATDLLPDGVVGLFRATELFPDPADWT
jgi:hypothetical protein